MKLSMICVVLGAVAAVANAGSIDIKAQDKSITITPTEDAWQQLVAPLSKVLACLLSIDLEQANTNARLHPLIA